MDKEQFWDHLQNYEPKPVNRRLQAALNLAEYLSRRQDAEILKANVKRNK